MTRFERSCGVVIYHDGDGGPRHYLLLHYPTGHWDFAKGHVEKGEEDLTTALRETREETGLVQIEVAPGFQHQFEYSYRHGNVLIQKRVTWFLARTRETGVTISHEHQGFAWLPYEEALRRVTYDNAKDLLRRAEEHLRVITQKP